MISIDKKYRVEGSRGECRIITTSAKCQGYPIIAEFDYTGNGNYQIAYFDEAGFGVGKSYRLIEVSPYAHIKEGDWCVFWNAALGPPGCSMSFGAFAGLTSDGYPKLHGELAHHGFHHCMPIDEFLEKYGNSTSLGD